MYYLPTYLAFSSTYEREITYDDDKWRLRVLNPLVTTLVAIAAPEPAAENDNPQSIQGEDGGPAVHVPGKVPTTTTKVLSATTVVGPLPPPADLLQHIKGSSRTNGGNDDNVNANGIATTQPQHQHNFNLASVGPDGGGPSPVPVPVIWEINAVWTVPEARRRGLAAALMHEAIHLVQNQVIETENEKGKEKEALERADEDDDTTAPAHAHAPPGLRYLTVGVEKNNTAALSLYKRSGYRPFSEVKEEEKDGGREFIYLYLPVPGRVTPVPILEALT